MIKEERLYSSRCVTLKSMNGAVALLTEGVDRNSFVIRLNRNVVSRPPHGGRG